AALEAPLQLAPVEREEVRALLPLDVDDLDELAGPHLVGERGRRVDPEVEPRLGQRRRELGLLVASRRGTPDLDEELPRGRPAGAATTPVTSRSARNACEEPGGDHSPKRRTALASAGSRPRDPSSWTRRLPSRAVSASRITVAGASAVAPSAVASSRPDASST